MLLGAHVSIAGGVRNAPQNGVNIGCDVIQLFTKNQRQWAAKPYTDEEIAAFRANYKQSGLRGAVAHGSYLINLATADDAAWKKSRESFLDEAQRCEALGIPDYVFHPGAHVGQGVDYAVQRIADALRATLDATQGARVRLDLECMAGQGTTIGDRFEDLARIIDLVGEKKRVGVCLDTCHMFAAGHDLVDPDGYEATIRHIDETVGLQRVRAFHLNDSQGPLDCRRDRHEVIGKGHIGRAGFANLMNDARFAEVPMSLETPPGTDDGYRADLKTLRALIGKRVPPPRNRLEGFRST